MDYRPIQNKNAGALGKRLREFQIGNRKALDQAWGSAEQDPVALHIQCNDTFFCDNISEVRV